MKTYTKNLIPAVGSLAFTVIASLQAAGRVETETPAIPSKRMVGVFCVRPYSLRLAEDDPGRSCFWLDGDTTSAARDEVPLLGGCHKGAAWGYGLERVTMAGIPLTV